MDLHAEQNNTSPGKRDSGNIVILWLNRAEDALLVTCLLVMIILAFANITMRNTIGGGIVWADKLLINLVLWVAVLGGAIASKDNDHITIDVISNLDRQ